MEKYTNDATTTLASGINNSVTSLSVSSATGFPTSGNFRIKIGSEIILVTAVSGTTFTVTRGQESTTGASHSGGDPVTHVLTAGALNAIRGDILGYDTYTNRPATPIASGLYVHSDGPIISHFDGSNWRGFGPIYKFVDPNLQTFTTNINTPNVYTTGKFQHFMEQNTGGSGPVGRGKAPPTAPYVVTVCILNNNISNFTNNGVCFGVKGSGGLSYMRPWHGRGNGGMRFLLTAATNVVDIDIVMSQIMWYRIEDDGTNLKYSISLDGEHFWQLYSETNTNYHGVVDYIWWGVEYFSGAAQASQATLLSWEE